MSMKKESSALMTVESEELDYEEDDINSPVKKRIMEKENDVEEGEILDTNVEKYPIKHVCCFFRNGKCYLGDKCSGRHVTNCLYKMIDPCEFQHAFCDTNPRVIDQSLSHRMIRLSPAIPFKYRNACPAYPHTNSSGLGNYKQCEPVLTDFDRALIEAKKLIKRHEKESNKASSSDTITIESDDENLSDKSSSKIRHNKSLKTKMLSTVNSKKDLNCSNKWFDPWRRSPIYSTKSISSFYRSRHKKSSPCSPECLRPNYLSIAKTRECKIAEKMNKGVIRRSLSGSSSTESTRCRKKRSSKSTRKKNTSTARDGSIKISKPCISKRGSPEIGKRRQKKNFRRSSSSSSRASIHRAIMENLKIMQQKKSSKRNKSDINFNSTSIRESREKVENWHRTVFSRSSSSSSRTSSINDYRSIKDSFKAKQKKTSATENKKEDKSKKFHDGRRGDIVVNKHKRKAYRSSTSSSPSSGYRSRVKQSNRKPELQSPKQYKFTSSVLEKISRSNKNTNLKCTSSRFMSDCHLKDICQWTPKKLAPPTAKICSDMSISPFTDSSLSDIFDPDKKASKDSTNKHEVSRSRSFQSSKERQVNGPISPPKNQILAPSNFLPTKSKVIKNNKFSIANTPGTLKCVTSLPDRAPENKVKSKKVKKQKVSNLEADLFKFHPEQIFPNNDRRIAPEPNPPNDMQRETHEQTPSSNVPRVSFEEISSNVGQRDLPAQTLQSNVARDSPELIILNDVQRDASELIILNDVQRDSIELSHPNEIQRHSPPALTPRNDVQSNDSEQTSLNVVQKYSSKQISPDDVQRETPEQISQNIVQGEVPEHSKNGVQNKVPEQISPNNIQKEDFEKIIPNSDQEEAKKQMHSNDNERKVPEQIFPSDDEKESKMRTKELLRKEIVKQLDAINAAIEKKKHMYVSQNSPKNNS